MVGDCYQKFSLDALQIDKPGCGDAIIDFVSD
jgi:hypothetical protein